MIFFYNSGRNINQMFVGKNIEKILLSLKLLNLGKLKLVFIVYLSQADL